MNRKENSIVDANRACKYCGATGLVWDLSGERAVLTESYGLPHGCDEREAHFKGLSDKKKQDYQAIKDRINAIPDGTKCDACDGGIIPGVHWHGSPSSRVRCDKCLGKGKYTAEVKRRILYHCRIKIWPSLNKGR